MRLLADENFPKPIVDLLRTAMKLGRTVRWDPAQETFGSDAAANATLSRPQRAPYGSDAVLARRG